MITKLDRVAIQDLTDRLLSARNSNLKMVLDINHRLESIGKRAGVEYIDDSKSTTVNATAYSLSCLDEPVVWLISCMDHQQDLSSLYQAVESGVKCIFYLGQDDDLFIEEFVELAGLVQRCDSMDEMLQEAARVATKGDVVLFSPACPTSEQYADYSIRGEAFKQAFEKLN